MCVSTNHSAIDHNYLVKMTSGIFAAMATIVFCV